jgi:hypothetical protein
MSEERRFDYVDRGRRLGRLRAGRPADEEDPSARVCLIEAAPATAAR